MKLKLFAILTLALFALCAANANAQAPTATPNYPLPVGENLGVDHNGKPMDRTKPFLPGIPSLSQARETTTGGILVSVYCGALGKSSHPTHATDGTPRAAYSWDCGNYPLGDFQLACYDVWGSNLIAVPVHGPDAVNWWRCASNGQQSVQTSTVVSNQVQATAVPQATASNAATAAATVNATCGPSPSRLSRGDSARVSDWDENPVKVYADTSTGSKELENVPVREQVLVLEGPNCNEGYTWVKVNTLEDMTGWMIEVLANGYYNLIPSNMPLPGYHGANSSSSDPVKASSTEVATTAATSAATEAATAAATVTVTDDCQKTLKVELAKGDKAATRYNTHVRSTDVMSQQNIIATLPSGTNVILVDGPYCSHGAWWWQIKSDTVTGWVYDSADGNRVLRLVAHATPVATQPAAKQ